MAQISLSERFHKHVGTEDANGCIPWMASRSKNRFGKPTYGQLTYRLNGKSKTYNTHRLAWLFAFGEIPTGMHVLHRCDNPICLNPDHLFLGTNADNMEDRNKKGRTKGCTGGEQHPKAKMTDAKVKKMRRQFAEGVRIYVLAKQYGIRQVTVAKIVYRRTWKHI